MAKTFSVEVGPAASKSETPPRRVIGAKDGAWTTAGNVPGLDTVYKHIKWCCEQHGPHPAMATRKFVKEHTEKKTITKRVDGKDQEVVKDWTYFEMSSYSSITYSDLLERIHHLGAGLVKLGVKNGGRELLHMYASTSAPWMQMALAANSQSIPFVTAYDTLGEEGLTHSMIETHTVAIFLDNAILSTLLKPLQAADDIRYIIHRDSFASKQEFESDPTIKKIKEKFPAIKIISFDELLELGKSNPIAPTPPSPQDLACIMYTSGSTGAPKGVVLLNKTLCAGTAGITGNIPTTIVTPSDRLLCFLPLAHIFELTLELSIFYWGATLGYGSVRTLSDTSMKNCKGDIREFKPTVLVGVPAVWESVRKGINGQIQKASFVAQKVFWSTYWLKSRLVSYGFGLPIIDQIIFKKVREATGGCLRYTMNGGSGISKETQNFISMTVAPMLLGYGATETCANGCLMTPDSWTLGCVGQPTHAVTIKLVDAPETGYYAKNEQGEIWIQSEATSPMYFENEEETKASMAEGGWFKTGDIGEWTKSGLLSIIDRKKNLVKTLNGEYIALEKLETVYRSNNYVANVCVVADSSCAKPLIVVMPLPAAFEKLCSDLKVDVDRAHENPDVVNALHRNLLETGRNGGLRGIELVCGVVISKDEWTPQSGLVTSAQKLQRRQILDRHKSAIDKVFGSQ